MNFNLVQPGIYSPALRNPLNDSALLGLTHAITLKTCVYFFDSYIYDLVRDASRGDGSPTREKGC